MSSTESITELLDDELFKASVRNILAGIVRAQQDTGEANANLALDALNYCVAMILEANPENAGQRGLRLAKENDAADLAMLLKLVRAQSDAQGRHMLDVLTGGETRQ